MIENSKQFNISHNSGHSQQLGAPTLRNNHQQALQLETSTFPIGSSNGAFNCPPHIGSLSSQTNKKSYLTNLFKVGGSSSFDRKLPRSTGVGGGGGGGLDMGSPANECAFDNPYFKDDAGYLRNRQENLNANLTKQQQLLYDSYNNKSHNNQGLLTTTTGAAFGHSTATGEINYNPRLQPETNEQLDFIEHHISNLHNRQVTSSVKELTIFGK